MSNLTLVSKQHLVSRWLLSVVSKTSLHGEILHGSIQTGTRDTPRAMGTAPRCAQFKRPSRSARWDPVRVFCLTSSPAERKQKKVFIKIVFEKNELAR